MLAASRRRRRLLAALFAVGGAFLLLVPEAYVPPSLYGKGLIAGPAFLLLGLTGLVYPAAIPDPRPPGGAVAAAAQAGAPGLVFGGCVFFLGLGIGAWLAFAR
jgi:hypothetical protein